MNATRSLFPGALGPDGYISCLDRLLADDSLRRVIILKGGPGVGKSTFMRRIHAALCPDGEPSTLYFCCADPDSLDALAVPHAGLLVLDGFPPHAADPLFPGARDSIIDLGRCLHAEAMRPRLPHIRACMDDRAAAFRRAQAWMKAAWALEQDASLLIASCMDEARLARMTRALTDTVLSGRGEPQSATHARPVITDALTPKGELSLIAENAQPRVIRLVRMPCMDLTQVLCTVSRAAQAAGYDTEDHLCPGAPGRLLHLTIPALGTLITTSDLLPSEQTFDFAACFPHASLLRHDCALEQYHAAIAQHTRLAADAMRQARQLHAELESFYIPNMDYGLWQAILDDTLADCADGADGADWVRLHIRST